MDPAELALIAVDATFGEFGRPATYAPPAGSAGGPYTVILDRSDRSIDYGASRITREGRVIEVRKSEVAQPRKGGTFVPGTIVGGVFVAGAESFAVLDDPRSEDPDRLVWTCTIG